MARSKMCGPEKKQEQKTLKITSVIHNYICFQQSINKRIL